MTPVENLIRKNELFIKTTLVEHIKDKYISIFVTNKGQINITPVFNFFEITENKLCGDLFLLIVCADVQSQSLEEIFSNLIEKARLVDNANQDFYQFLFEDNFTA